MDASQRPVLSPVLRRVSTTPAGGKTVMPERIDIRAVLAVAAKPGCVSLGRSEVCDVTLRGPDRVKNLHMSRIQAELRLSSEGVVLQFLGNTGLSVNRKALRARESVWLRDGDVVEFMCDPFSSGDYGLCYKCEGFSPATLPNAVDVKVASAAMIRASPTLPGNATKRRHKGVDSPRADEHSAKKARAESSPSVKVVESPSSAARGAKRQLASAVSSGSAAGAGGGAAADGAGEDLSAGVSVDRMQGSLECGICMEIMVDPMLYMPCSHNFCGTCAEHALELKVDCPICRTPSTGLVPANNIKDLLAMYVESLSQAERSEYKDRVDARAAVTSKKQPSAVVARRAAPRAAVRGRSVLADPHSVGLRSQLFANALERQLHQREEDRAARAQFNERARRQLSSLLGGISEIPDGTALLHRPSVGTSEVISLVTSEEDDSDDVEHDGDDLEDDSDDVLEAGPSSSPSSSSYSGPSGWPPSSSPSSSS